MPPWRKEKYLPTINFGVPCLFAWVYMQTPNLWSPQNKNEPWTSPYNQAIDCAYANMFKCTSKAVYSPEKLTALPWEMMVGSDDSFPFKMVVPFRGTFTHFGEVVICGLGSSGLEFEKYIYWWSRTPAYQLTGVYFPPFSTPKKIQPLQTNMEPEKRPVEKENPLRTIPAVRFQEIHVDSPLSNCFARHPLNTVWATQTPPILGMLIDCCLPLPFLYHWKEICRQVSTNEQRKINQKTHIRWSQKVLWFVCIPVSFATNCLYNSPSMCSRIFSGVAVQILVKGQKNFISPHLRRVFFAAALLRK